MKFPFLLRSVIAAEILDLFLNWSVRHELFFVCAYFFLKKFPNNVVAELMPSNLVSLSASTKHRTSSLCFYIFLYANKYEKPLILVTFMPNVAQGSTPLSNFSILLHRRV